MGEYLNLVARVAEENLDHFTQRLGIIHYKNERRRLLVARCRYGILPIVNAQDSIPTPGDKKSPPLVFVVDDSEALGEMIKIFLSDAGYEVQVFSHPLQALSAMESGAAQPQL